MIEIKSASLADSRQRNASTKAKTERPQLSKLTPDTYQVQSTSYHPTYASGWYDVRFLRSDDKIFAQCECEAGHNNRPCYHVMHAYDTDYSVNLTIQGSQLLASSRQAIAGLGFVGTKSTKPVQVLNLAKGQVFEAAVPVQLTIEPR